MSPKSVASAEHTFVKDENNDGLTQEQKRRRLQNMTNRTEELLGKQPRTTCAASPGPDNKMQTIDLHEAPRDFTSSTSTSIGRLLPVEGPASPSSPTQSPDIVAGPAPPSSSTYIPGPVEGLALPPSPTSGTWTVKGPTTSASPTPTPMHGMPPHQLSTILDAINNWETPAPLPTEFRFSWDKAAATHNLKVLEQYDMDLERALRSQPFSSLTFGSEFRPVPVLEPLFGRHPLWPRVRTYLLQGVQHPVSPIAEVDRLHDLGQMVQYGNHKSAQQELPRLINMLKDEVKRTWQLPLPRRALVRLPNCVLAPLGMVKQATINERGEIADKWRLTHDQTFEVTPGAHRSVNHRIQFEELTPCMYGKAILRYVYIIVTLRASNQPNESSKPKWIGSLPTVASTKRPLLQYSRAPTSTTWCWSPSDSPLAEPPIPACGVM